MEKSYGYFGEAGFVLCEAMDDSTGKPLLVSEVDDIIGHLLNAGWELKKVTLKGNASCVKKDYDE